MSEEATEGIRPVPPDAPDEEELNLVDDDEETLEEDGSGEAEAEAGMSDAKGEGDLAPTEDINFVEDESGVAQ